ncbi:MAG: DUF2169 domain-containing protein [Sandaracinaceae bacterium]|nr:MAG: DUF2169 domain-containing protein [Sandaracinaceae bacterium]
MELLKDTPLEVGWLTWSPNPGRTALTVAVKATFDLAESGEATLAEAQRFVTGDEHHEDDVERSLRWASDLAPLKPRGECWVVGGFHAPHGLPVTTSMVAFQIGPVGKRLAVAGDRVWRATGPSEPSEITTMPLSWERAFGGPGLAANPVGRGLAGALVPNVEDPEALVQSSGQRPVPAGCGPLPRTWKARARWAGTYDARWLAERYPGFAEDLDYRYFLAAPEDQQIEGFWRGDETIRLRHLHPAHPNVDAKLPGLRAQAFLVRGGALTDVGLRLDTIAIDADAGQAVAIWRGLTDLPSAGLDAVDHLFVVHQEAGDRHGLAEYGAWYQEALAAESAPDPEEVDEEPPSAVTAPAAAPEAEQPFVDADAPGAKWAHLDQAMTVRGDDTALSAAVAAELEKRRAEEKAKAFRPVFEDALQLEPTDEPAETLSPEEALALEMEQALGDVLTEEVNEALARLREAVREGASCAGWDLVGANLAGASLEGLDLTEAIFAGANFSGAFFRGCTFDGASLTECELSDAVFEGCTFIGADFSPCRAQRVRFERCKLDGASAVESFFRSARFAESSLVGTDLAGSDLGESTFEKCNLDEVDVTAGTLEQAKLIGCTLIDAWLEGVRADRAVFDRCDCTLLRASEEASFEGASFKQSRLDGARFSTSKLRAADFSLASLARADFSGAMLAQARIMGASLRNASFDGAVLVQASLMKSDLFQARLEGANLKYADLRGCNLYQAELHLAELEGARLDLADITGTRIA